MLANAITLTRLLLTFAVITMFGGYLTLDIALIAMIALIFILDALDGRVARRRNETSKLGAVLDTLSDRIIENTFWIYFSATEQLPVWMPITVMARGFITDTLQNIPGITGEAAERRKKEKNDCGWAHALTQSRISRGLYGVIKMLAFMTLAGATVFKSLVLEHASLIIATVTVGFCLLRGLPTFRDIYKTIRKRNTDAKRLFPIPQSTKKLTQPKISKKAV